MVTGKTRTPVETEPVAPQTAPTTPGAGMGYGSDFNGFIWQQLSDIQSKLGAIQESQRQLAAAQDKAEIKTSGKLSSIETDLAEIKQIKHTGKWLLIVAAAIGGVVLAAVGFISKEVWDISKPLVLEKLAERQPAGTTVAPAKVPPVVQKQP